MSFRTKIKDYPSSRKFSHTTRFLTLGSCFANCVESKLKRYNYPIIDNPIGICYNPISIAKHLQQFIDHTSFNSNGIINRDGLFFHEDCPSQIFAHSEEELIEILNRKVHKVNDKLPNLDVLIITLGTSFVFTKKENNNIVNNCHKLPNQIFDRQLLDVDTIVKSLSQVIDQYQESYPNLTFIFTVSPVKHIRDGLVENNLSKSILRVVCHELTQTKDDAYYFPSYEIMMDDLRDYRFYKADMIHPNEQAEDYIWEFFCNHFIDEQSKGAHKRIDNLKNGIAHRPILKNSDAYHSHLFNLQKKLENMQSEYQNINWTKEAIAIKKLQDSL